jgi:hypothetical protein
MAVAATRKFPECKTPCKKPAMDLTILQSVEHIANSRDTNAMSDQKSLLALINTDSVKYHLSYKIFPREY